MVAKLSPASTEWTPLGHLHPRVEIGISSWTPPFAFSRVVLQEVVFEGAPGEFQPRADEPADEGEREAARAWRELVAGNRAVAEPLLAQVAARPGPSQTLASLLDAVALAEGGDEAGASERLVQLGRSDPAALDPLLEAANALTPRARAALATAYAFLHGRDARALAQRAAACRREGHMGEGLIAAVGGRIETVGAAGLLAHAWADIGEQERALQILERLPDDPGRRALEGEWLCDLHRYDEALERFGDAPLVPYDEAFRRRAQRFSSARAPRAAADQRR